MIRPMQFLKNAIIQNREETKVFTKAPLFAPAGQSTQMVIGATPETDLQILFMADHFYKQMQLKRVYYSGYVPISNDNRLPAIGTPVPMIRENRLYQADWLMRFYGFGVHEIVSPGDPHLDMEIDPKLAWALRNRDIFPIDINKADLRLIMRVPGIGVLSARKIYAARRFRFLNWEHLKKLGISYNRARYFITCNSTDYERKDLSSMQIRQQILAKGKSKYEANFTAQLTMF